MHSSPGIRRAVFLLMDGLRADAVSRFPLPILSALAAEGASTFSAQTVKPSVTAAAMTSIFTGLPPEEHGIAGQTFAIPKDLYRLRPLPRLLLSHASLPTSVLAAQIPLAFRWLSRRLAAIAAVGEAHFDGDGCDQVLDLAATQLRAQTSGLIFMHWPDADRAGHVHGWTSHAYEAAARRMDARLADLVALIERQDAETLLIVCSDHGGGGARSDDHDSTHPDDTTIPIILSGSTVHPTVLRSGVTLLDLPATLLWSFGVPIPPSYRGRPLIEAFGLEAAAA
ncbi:MAG: sulfatase-like hydrolase/transferase [Gemmatimonas sp.]|nr:sulfatase-like hydrolase/transferase [Gemmatimonas sp.]